MASSTPNMKAMIIEGLSHNIDPKKRKVPGFPSGNEARVKSNRTNITYYFLLNVHFFSYSRHCWPQIQRDVLCSMKLFMYMNKRPLNGFN